MADDAVGIDEFGLKFFPHDGSEPGEPDMSRDSSNAGEVALSLRNANDTVAAEQGRLDETSRRLTVALDQISEASDGTGRREVIGTLLEARLGLESIYRAGLRLDELTHAVERLAEALAGHAGGPAGVSAEAGPSRAVPSGHLDEAVGHVVRFTQDVWKEPADQSDATSADDAASLGSLPHVVWDREAPLRSLLPEMAVVEDRARTLNDPELRNVHGEAARDIIDALRLGVRGLLVSRPNLDRLPAFVLNDQPASALQSLAEGIDSAASAQGLAWPPADVGQAASVLSDLSFFFRCAATQAENAPSLPTALLTDTLRGIEQRCDALLTRWQPEFAEPIGRATAARDEPGARSRIGSVFSGAALIISLLQGPGALLDLPDDLADLASVIAAAAITLWSILSDFMALIDALLS
ncbi:hypothetical protein OWR29_38950 [Actinoplanes sp. Pm04-4]|uniref:Uncharacterized protein n=1 Tax=Paractinoplanes pyxinae TaxID=2997416 RepID=A0ABT4BBV9_9ACTN|nr:hypothetical protein [Actinoplanes pyxinae]MCY1144009.1 hypothetical protein [Actinoplanes pyxinae]